MSHHERDIMLAELVKFLVACAAFVALVMALPLALDLFWKWSAFVTSLVGP